MARVEVPLARQSAVSQSLFVSGEDLTNLIAEQRDGEEVLYSAPGLEAFVTFANGPVRGAIAVGDEIHVVSATRFYTVTEDGTATDRGEVTGSLPVTMAYNGFETVIQADEESFTWNGATFAAISDADFEQSSSVAFIAQYIASSIADTGQFQISALANATSWNAIDKATAESTPDNLVRVLEDSGDLMLMGVATIEPWAHTGNADFPFEARVGSVINIGLLGKHAVAKVDNSFAFLGSDKKVHILRGATAIRISTHDVEREIADWDDPQNSRAFAATIGGHAYWFLWNPQGCLVWDAATTRWHRRETVGQATWRAGCGVENWNKAFVGDASEGALYRLREGVYTDAGDTMVRTMVSRTQSVGGQPFTVNEIELEIEVGVGVVSGQGSDPEVWLEASRDGGYEFGGRLQRKLGARGARNRRVTWTRLGQFPPHGGVVRIGVSDPVAVTMTRMWADVERDAA